MLRTCYSLLLRFHPAPFRRCYEKEMLAIFDDVAAMRECPRDCSGMPPFQFFGSGYCVPNSVTLNHASLLRSHVVMSPILGTLDSYPPRPAWALLIGCLFVCRSSLFGGHRKPPVPEDYLQKLADRRSQGDRECLAGQQVFDDGAGAGYFGQIGSGTGKSMAGRRLRLFQTYSRADITS